MLNKPNHTKLLHGSITALGKLASASATAPPINCGMISETSIKIACWALNRTSRD
eukprot:CAMPEP_0196196614 /NCGR_PEP_ID=MMETSP0912-20130531/1396_1 /TAXON_ID=49265 /ORGANISM="Thalassiosira rotula, Strain GSO102" /LENGTH=54 /DNA_ID=CAMNT_0041469351 /DNA_START=292 /DNA_END=456 /DNA_ORIENTATION=+